MVVVDGLDEWLDLAALGNLLGTHSLGDLGWVALNTGDEGIREGVGFGTGIVGLDDDDL